MVAMMVMMLGEIGARMFRRTLPFAWEYGAYLNGAVFFLAAAYTTHTGGHIRVEWAKRLPRNVFRTIELVATSVACAVSALLTVSLIQYAYDSYADLGALRHHHGDASRFPEGRARGWCAAVDAAADRQVDPGRDR